METIPGEVEKKAPLMLQEILSSDDLLTKFRKYCMKQRCIENLLFIERVGEFKKMTKETEKYQKIQKIIEEFMRMESIFELNVNQAQFKEVHIKMEETPIPMEIFDSIHTTVEILMTGTIRNFEKDLQEKKDVEIEDVKLEVGREDKIFGFLKKTARKDSVDHSGLFSKPRAQTDRQNNGHNNSMLRLFKFNGEDSIERKKSITKNDDEKFLNSAREVDSEGLNSSRSIVDEKEQKPLSLLEMLKINAEDEEEEQEVQLVKTKPSNFKQMFMYNRSNSFDMRQQQQQPQSSRPFTDRGQKNRFIDITERTRSLSDTMGGDEKNDVSKKKQPKSPSKLSIGSPKKTNSKFQELPQEEESPMSFLEMLQGSEKEAIEMEEKKKKMKEHSDTKSNTSSDKEILSPKSRLGILDMITSSPRKIIIQEEEVKEKKPEIKKEPMSFLEMLQMGDDALIDDEEEEEEKPKRKQKKPIFFQAHKTAVSSKPKEKPLDLSPQTERSTGKTRQGFMDFLKEENQKKKKLTETKPQTIKEVIPKENEEMEKKNSTLGFLEMLQDYSLTKPKEDDSVIIEPNLDEEQEVKPMSFLEMLQAADKEEEEEEDAKSDFGTTVSPKKGNQKKKQTKSEKDGNSESHSPKVSKFFDKLRGNNPNRSNSLVESNGGDIKRRGSFVERLKPKKKISVVEEDSDRSSSVTFIEIQQEEKVENEKPMSLLEMLKMEDEEEVSAREVDETKKSVTGMKKVFQNFQKPRKSITLSSPQEQQHVKFFDRFKGSRAEKKTAKSDTTRSIDEEDDNESLDFVSMISSRGKSTSNENLQKTKMNTEENPFEKLAQEKLKGENPFEKLAQKKLKETKIKEENPFEKLAQEKLKEKLKDETLKDENPFEKLAQEKLKEKSVDKKDDLLKEENPFEKLAREKLKNTKPIATKEENPFEKLAREKLKEENPFEKLAQEKLKEKDNSFKKVNLKENKKETKSKEENPFEKLAQEKLKEKLKDEILKEENPFEKLAREKLGEKKLVQPKIEKSKEENPFEKLAQEKLKEKDNSFKKTTIKAIPSKEENPFEKLAQEKLKEKKNVDVQKEENPFEKLAQEKLKERENLKNENPFEKLAQEKMKEREMMKKKTDQDLLKKLEQEAKKSGNPIEKIAQEAITESSIDILKVSKNFQEEKEENPFEKLYREKKKEKELQHKIISQFDIDNENLIFKKSNEFLQEIKRQNTQSDTSKTSNLDLIFDKIKKSREKKESENIKDEEDDDKSTKEELSSRDSSLKEDAPKEKKETEIPKLDFESSDGPLSPTERRIFTPRDNPDLKKLRMANRKYSSTRKLLIRTPTPTEIFEEGKIE
eukprot:gene1677-446_t